MTIDKEKFMKICNKLKEKYVLMNNEIEIEYETTQGAKSLVRYHQKIVKNDKDIGGIKISDEKNNLIDLKGEIIEKEIHIDIMMKIDKRRIGNGRNTLAILFCNPKVRKIKYKHLDISLPFWKSVDPYFEEEKFNHELTKETFFRYNIDKIISTLENCI